nr:hypothetical protein [Psychrobacter sp. PraFG1]UNK06283.1 hypothetical protein MN210_06930 [Psychrobacter sp. PraFG1]
MWHYFYALTQIPRPSYEEEAVQQFVLDEAAKLGLWAERDAAGNVLVRKPATAGMENAPGVILQNHLDMVAQKMPTAATTLAPILLTLISIQSLIMNGSPPRARR